MAEAQEALEQLRQMMENMQVTQGQGQQGQSPGEQAMEGLAETLREQHPALHISTLRGQLSDNREWLKDPAAPAIIIGTADMVDPRLLFSVRIRNL